MKNRRRLAILAGCALLASGCAGLNPPPLETVPHVELARYTGKWYEIARYPNSFQRGCVGTTAEYAIRVDGRISVLNRCWIDSFDGRLSEIEGAARVVDPQTNAKLAVSFFGPFEGPYWILELGADYEFAVVGEPSRSTLWILSRTPTMDTATYEAILARLPEKGYDPSRLLRTEQR